MGEQRFAGIETGAGDIAGGGVEDVKEGLFAGVIWQPGMRLTSYCQSGPSSQACQRLNGAGNV